MEASKVKLNSTFAPSGSLHSLRMDDSNILKVPASVCLCLDDSEMRKSPASIVCVTYKRQTVERGDEEKREIVY